MIRTWHEKDGSGHTRPRDVCRNVASVDLGDQFWPMTARMLSNMYMWPTDYAGTIRWPDWTDCMVKTSDVVEPTHVRQLTRPAYNM